MSNPTAPALAERSVLLAAKLERYIAKDRCEYPEDHCTTAKNIDTECDACIERRDALATVRALRGLLAASAPEEQGNDLVRAAQRVVAQFAGGNLIPRPGEDDEWVRLGITALNEALPKPSRVPLTAPPVPERER